MEKFRPDPARSPQARKKIKPVKPEPAHAVFPKPEPVKARCSDQKPDPSPPTGFTGFLPSLVFFFVPVKCVGFKHNWSPCVKINFEIRVLCIVNRLP